MVSHFHIIFLAIDLQKTYAWWCEMYCQKHWKEKEEQHAKALEACLICGYHIYIYIHSSVGGFKDSEMMQRTKHLEPKTTGQTKAHDLQRPAAVLRYSIYLLKSDSRIYRFDFATRGLQAVRTRQLSEHSENLQAWTGVFL